MAETAETTTAAADANTEAMLWIVLIASLLGIGFGIVITFLAVDFLLAVVFL